MHRGPHSGAVEKMIIQRHFSGENWQYISLARIRQELWFCALNTSGAVYCNRSCLFVCLCVCGFVGLLPQPEIACIDLHQTGSVGEDSDCLHLIKFWPVLRPRKGSAWGENRRRFTTASLPARSVCERFFIYFLKSKKINQIYIPWS